MLVLLFQPSDPALKYYLQEPFSNMFRAIFHQQNIPKSRGLRIRWFFWRNHPDFRFWNFPEKVNHPNLEGKKVHLGRKVMDLLGPVNIYQNKRECYFMVVDTFWVSPVHETFFSVLVDCLFLSIHITQYTTVMSCILHVPYWSGLPPHTWTGYMLWMRSETSWRGLVMH